MTAQTQNRFQRPLLSVVLLAGVVLTAGGCATGPGLPKIQDADQFRTVMVTTQQPVLVMFSKVGCPACGSLEPKLANLSQEYDGRVTFAKFELVNGFMRITSRELQNEFQISLLPTVILFESGRESARWVNTSKLDSYRKRLDDFAAPE